MEGGGGRHDGVMLTDDNAPDRVPGRREPSSPICATSYFAELAADSYGTGSEAAPLVLVHGLTYDRSTWGPALTELGRIDPARRVIALDLPGHGESPRRDSYRL